MLGRGNTSTVYLCNNLEHEQVAIKWSDLPHAAARKRAEQEASVLLQLKHPNIIPCYSKGECDERFFIVMPYIEGGDLRTVTQKLHTRPPYERYKTCKDVYMGLLSALEYLHKNGCPLPENICKITKDRDCFEYLVHNKCPGYNEYTLV